MTQNKDQCADCKSPLRRVSLSDLIGERKRRGLEEIMPAAGVVFDHFDFRVCGQCGYTLIWANSATRSIATRSDSAEGDINPT
jgi:uncharacterized protein with PIN domain